MTAFGATEFKTDDQNNINLNLKKRVNCCNQWRISLDAQKSVFILINEKTNALSLYYEMVTYLEMSKNTYTSAQLLPQIYDGMSA